MQHYRSLLLGTFRARPPCSNGLRCYQHGAAVADGTNETSLLDALPPLDTMPGGVTTRLPLQRQKRWLPTFHAGRPSPRSASDLALSAGTACCLSGDGPPRLAAVPVQCDDLASPGRQLTWGCGTHMSEPCQSLPPSPSCFCLGDRSCKRGYGQHRIHGGSV